MLSRPLNAYAELIPWQELEEAYALRFNTNVGAPAKPVRLAFGSLYIKQRLGHTDEDLRHINEFVVQRGKEMLIEAAASQSHDGDSGGDDQDDVKRHPLLALALPQ